MTLYELRNRIILVAASCMLIWFIYALFSLSWYQLKSLTWQEVPCVIDDLQRIAGERDSYFVKAKYHYQVADKTYHSDRITFDFLSESSFRLQGTIYRELESHRVSGEPFPGYVNPSNFSEAILYREGDWPAVCTNVLYAQFGIFAAFLLVWSLQDWQDHRELMRLTNNEPAPWQLRADWVKGEFVHSHCILGRSLLGIGLGMFLISLPAVLNAFIILQLPYYSWWVATSFIFAIVPWFVVFLGYYTYQRWLRFGSSVLKLESTPGVLGGNLVGIVHVEKLVANNGGYRTSLRCMARTAENLKEKYIYMSTVWRQDHLVFRDLSTSPLEGSRIPLSFCIPYELPETSITDAGTTYHWYVEVQSLEGKAKDRYHVDFCIPILRTAKSDQHFPCETSSLDGYQLPVDSLELLRESGLKFLPAKHDGFLIVLPMLRGIGNLLLPVGLLAALLIVLMVLAVGGLIGGNVIGLLIAIPAYFVARGIARLLFYHSEIEVEPGVLRFREGYFSGGDPWEIKADEIERFSLKDAKEGSNEIAHDLLVHLKNGRECILGRRIASLTIATDIIQRIEQTLRQSASSQGGLSRRRKPTSVEQSR